MTVLRTGASKKYSDNWEAAFGGMKKKTTKKKAAGNKNNVENDEQAVEDIPVIPERTLEDVKRALAGVWKAKGKGAAVEILEKFNVERSDDLPSNRYQAAIDLAEACLK